MLSVKVGRLRRDRGISVARPTALGNPFEIGKPYTREEAIDRYREWFAERVAERSPRVVAQLERIVAAARTGEVTLLCHCAPRPCHADVIAQWVRAVPEDSSSRGGNV